MSTPAARLPGLRFVAQPPASPDVLPRMDVACFVGFAAGGPFHTPVAIEDPAQLVAIFGDDLSLALDPETDELAYAQLVPSVRAFLQGGGQRCWVVRVGEDEGVEPLALPVSGLAVRDAGGSLRPATLLMRSPGTWADDAEVSAVVQSEPAELLSLTVSKDAPRRPLAQLRFARAQAVVAGDLLRLRGDGWTLLAPVRPIVDDAGAELDLDRAVWTRALTAADIAGTGRPRPLTTTAAGWSLLDHSRLLFDEPNSLPDAV